MRAPQVKVSMKTTREFGQRTFAALSIPNYRLYFSGQSISLVGTWMQTTAQAWLVLRITHSSTDLGFVVALQTLPVLLLAPYGGVIADRVDKRRMMVALQICMGLQALALGVLALLGVVRLWEICFLAVVLGLNNTFENPSRQAFIREMVGRNKLRNAVTLNSVMSNAARAVGPAIAGVLIATVGEGICFILNSASFAAVVTSLLIMDKSSLRQSTPERREPGQLREGLAYAVRTTDIAVPLLMMGIVGMLAYEFQVSLPVFANADVSRWFGRLWLHDRVDGSRGCRRGSLHRGPRPHGASADGPRLCGVWPRDPVHLPRARPPRFVSRSLLRRLGERLFRVGRQLDHPVVIGGEHARQGAFALAARLPRDDTGRRPAHRLGDRPV